MIQITYHKKGIRITQIWFSENIFKSENLKTDILFYHGVSQAQADNKCLFTEFHTLISNLDLPEEELLSRINKNVRYEIRRNCKEEAEYRVFPSAELQQKPEIITQFADMYEAMYRQKGQKAVFNRIQFLEYLKQNAILLTAIYQEELPLVFHSYIVGEKQVRLLHSVSDFRSGETDANLVARANKRLHWEDMLLFKKQGKKIYDWGGVSSLEEPNGIDAFKFKFGGEPLTYYNAYRGSSFLGKAAVAIMKRRNGKK